MTFTYITCMDCVVEDLEKSLIVYLQPVTNSVRYQNYVPKEQHWSKYYG